VCSQTIFASSDHATLQKKEHEEVLKMKEREQKKQLQITGKQKTDMQKKQKN
jgi:hypothetical protein